MERVLIFFCFFNFIFFLKNRGKTQSVESAIGQGRDGRKGEYQKWFDRGRKIKGDAEVCWSE